MLPPLATAIPLLLTLCTLNLVVVGQAPDEDPRHWSKPLRPLTSPDKQTSQEIFQTKPSAFVPEHRNRTAAVVTAEVAPQTSIRVANADHIIQIHHSPASPPFDSQSFYQTPLQPAYANEEESIESNIEQSRSGSWQAPNQTNRVENSSPPSNYEIEKSTSTNQRAIQQTSDQSQIHPLLIYSIRYEIKSFDLYASNPAHRSQSLSINPQPQTLSSFSHQEQHPIPPFHRQSKTLIAGLKNTIGLDFYYSENESYIFWTDVIEERIYKGTIINGTITNVDIVVQTGLSTGEGLAVDWVGQNIYWIESTLDHIEVANMNGKSRRTLIAGDMESPRAIAVDPRFGLLFWTDWDKKDPRIERATMAGEDRKTIVHIKDFNGGWPNGLALDYETLKFYWIDANSDSIHVADYEGKRHQTLLNNIKSLGHPFAITLYENNLYWTDWKTNTVSTANKNNGSDAREIQRLAQRLFDIKVFHPSRQPRIDDSLNPCHYNNGNCSHLCLLSINSTRKCECPHLMKLALDRTTCETDERVLLIGKTNEIRAVNLFEPLHNIMAPISVPKVFHPKQFEYDSKSKTIFWADSQTNEVKSTQLAGNNIETVIDVIIEAPSGLALDWISGNIYVTSAPQLKASGKIYISNLHGEYISILMNGSQGLIAPRSLAVHPTLGLLFCVDENENSEAIIFSASMDGRNKRIIASRLNDPRLDDPSNLAIDYELNRVYWINQANNMSEKASIQYYDILEDSIVTILDENEVETSQRINPSVLCVDGDDLIVSTRMPNENIIKMSKHNLTERTILRTQKLEQLSALRVYNVSSQSGTNACSLNNGNCSQLCVPTNSTHRTCKCTMGYSSNPNNATECVGKDLFLILSYNLGMKGISLELNSSSEDYYLPPIHKAFRASSIDYMYRDNLIYWVDHEEGSITRINRDTTNYKVVIQGLESEESIAIDWVARNIYWLDPYYDIIEVARLDGSYKYVIVSGDMDKANGIVVNPIKGYLVWSDTGSSPKIETALLDGSNRRVVVNLNMSHVEDLTIDCVEDYIYWIDSTLAVIERIREDGTGRHVVFNFNTNQGLYYHYTSIAIYKEHLFIADSVHDHGSIIRCDKNNATDRRVVQQHLGDAIRDIAIFAEQPLPSPEENPCVKDNGGCQELCIYLGQEGKKRCICSHGKLEPDGLTCKPYDTFILFSKLSQIDSLHITDEESFNNSPHPPITIENRSSIISLTVDYDAQRVIYSDLPRDQICSIFFNGTDRIVLVEKQSLVEGIAFADDQLYWTSIHDNSVSRLNITSSGGLNCTKCTPVVEKIVKLSLDDRPRGIAVDSCTSYVYWTNWNNNASIQRASPHNGYKVESIIKDQIKVPNGIAIDQQLRKLYWCDAKLDKIESCDMDGTNRNILISASPQHPFALAVWGSYVFWTDWVARGVFRADKYQGRHPIQIKKVPQRPMGIAVVQPVHFLCPKDYCSINNGGCPNNYQCIAHYSSSWSGTFTPIECRLSSEVDHSLHLPPLRHCPGKVSKDGSCEHSSYRDIIMDSFERYNYSELNPLLPETVPSGSETTKVPDNTTDLSTRVTIPLPVYDGVLPRSNPNKTVIEKKQANQQATENISTTQVTVNQTKTTATIAPEKTTKATEPRYVESSTVKPLPPVSTSTTVPYPIGTSESISTTTTTAGAEKAQTTNAPLPTQAPINNITPAPCHQIVPAALQPTTDSTSVECKLPGQFRCYLSDKLVCISGDRRCDGIHDCPNKEDENDCLLAKRSQYNFKRTTNWHKFVMVFLFIVTAAVVALFLLFGNRSRRPRWFPGKNGAFNHRRMFDDNGTNIEISNPMFDEDDSGHLVHCAFSIDLNERTTNFSNPLYERQVLLMNDKHVTPS